MKKTIKHLSVIALATLLIFGSTLSAFAASVTPSHNNSQHDPVLQGYLTIKFDYPRDDDDDLYGMEIEVDFSRDDKWVEWDSNLPVEYVYVKGGNTGYLYHYPGGATSDKFLRAPNNSGGKHPDISHVTFYFKLGKITINKEVNGTPNVNETFEFEIEGPYGYSETVSIVGAGSVSLFPLAFGDYTITEINIPNNYEIDDDDKEVEIKWSNKHRTVTFVNNYEEPTTEEPTTEEPTTEEPTTEEPTTEEPTTEEPTTEEPTTEEPTTEEPTTEEPTTEEPTTEEPTTEEPTTEEPTTEEPTTEEPTTEEPTTEEPTTEEPTTEQPTTEEPPTELPTETPTEPPTELPTEVPTESPTEVIEEEDTPLGPAITFTDIDSFLEPEMPELEEEVELIEEEVPLADALPETGQLPIEMFYGLGSLISISGIALKKKQKK